ncbi:complement component 1 Q subcomponent-binding protein, mitochondrial isoform X2 [Folsomia candida]|uniref:complement component 1 Q subcomponent-binding protein, mitochondrial isoform X2 n=1 Tax=Folsomia candida TaxID=158441 RepID=UPI000B8F352E|nr:complement component 1 Q subcomponent-binding protein, mitochondrial isoform X2 [Folsomia candida]
MFLRSVISKLASSAEQAMVKVVQTPRFLHTNALVGGSKGLLRPAGLLRPLGTVKSVHDTKAKGDDELVSFLTEEIATEKKNQRAGPLPSNLDGFEIQLDQSELTFTKKFNQEKVVINFNVNHTVDADYADEQQLDKGGQQAEKDAEMRSRPNFEIEITKGNKILSFSCSYLQDAGAAAADPQQDEYQDAFVIDEISIYEGEWNEQTYAVAGDILDGYLYDLFMNMLEERGITNEFAEKMSDFATDYEHKLYTNLLGQLQGFLTSK